MPYDQIDLILPALFDLSPPPESPRGIERDSSAEPTLHLPGDYAPTATNLPDRGATWDGIVPKLLSGAASGKSLDRTSAIVRLYRLHQWRFLKPSEIEAFAHALWLPGRRDAFGLPAHTNLLAWTLLQMPEEEPGQAEAALRRYIVEQSHTANGSLYSRIDAVGDVVQGFVRVRGDLLLSDDERNALKKLVLTWIHTRTKPSSEGSAPFSLHDRQEGCAVESIATLLRYISLDATDLDLLWLKAEEMDNGQEGSHLAAPLYPIFAGIWPERSNLLLDRLRRGLASDNEDTVREAVIGSSRWLQALRHEQGLVDPGLKDVIREIGIVIAGRRIAVLPNALEFAEWLFRSGPAPYRTLIAADCDFGLSALLIEASYERADPPADLPRLRACAMRLATAMNQTGFGDGAGVRGWLNAAANDPLPEVRNSAAPSSRNRS